MSEPATTTPATTTPLGHIPTDAELTAAIESLSAEPKRAAPDSYIPADIQLADVEEGLIDNSDIESDERPVFVGTAICHVKEAKWIRKDGSDGLKILFVWETDGNCMDNRVPPVLHPPGAIVADFITIKAESTQSKAGQIEEIGFQTIERNYLAAAGKYAGPGGAKFRDESAAKLKADLIREGYLAAHKQDVANVNIKFIIGKPVVQKFKARYRKTDGTEDRTLPPMQGFGPQAVKRVPV